MSANSPTNKAIIQNAKDQKSMKLTNKCELVRSFLMLITVIVLIGKPEALSSKELNNEWRETLESTINQSKIHGEWRKGYKQFEFINDVFTKKVLSDNEADLLFKSDTLFVCYFYNYWFHDEKIYILSTDYIKFLRYEWYRGLNILSLTGSFFKTWKEYNDSRINALYGLLPTKEDYAEEDFENAIIQWNMPLPQDILDPYIKYFGEWCFDVFRIIRKPDGRFSTEHYYWPEEHRLL